MINQDLLKKATEFLNKTSQRRSRLDRIMDYNPMNSSIEYFNKDIKSMMSKIRESDSIIRRIFLPSNKRSPVQLIKNCETLFKKREYMQCVILLDEIRGSLAHAKETAISLNNTIKTNYKDFFISKLEGKEKKDLISLRNKMEAANKRAKSDRTLQMVKEAGVLDWFRSSIFTQRGRALRAWEKAHGEEVAALKENLLNMISETKSILSDANDSLKDMSVFISRGDISSYFKSLKNFEKIYKKYDNMFIKLYNENIKNMINELVDDEEEIEVTDDMLEPDVSTGKKSKDNVSDEGYGT